MDRMEQVKHLRTDPRWLKVVWGLGYKMEKGGL